MTAQDVLKKKFICFINLRDGDPPSIIGADKVKYWLDYIR